MSKSVGVMYFGVNKRLQSNSSYSIVNLVSNLLKITMLLEVHLRHKSLLYPLISLMGLLKVQGLTGINTVTSWLGVFLQSSL